MVFERPFLSTELGKIKYIAFLSVLAIELLHRNFRFPVILLIALFTH